MTMQFTNDNRGVSEVIGAILVFGLLIALMAILQTQAIPAANEEVEFNHNQDVQNDLMKFDERTSETAAHGTTESARVRMGTTYPNRFLFFNPPSPSGTIRTVGEETANISGIQAVDENTRKYIGANSNYSINNIESKRLEYSPNYNEYDNSPKTVLEYGTLYNEYGDGEFQIKNNGTILSGNTIDLTFFGGSLSRTSSSAQSLDAQPTSAPKRTVIVEPKVDSNENVTITLPSNLPAEEWNTILEGEQNFKEAISIDGTENMVEIRLNSNISYYELEMAQIGIGKNIPDNDAAYIVPVGGQSTSEIGARTNSLPFEVRDKYNNPVSGKEVNISVNHGQFGNGENITTTTTDQRGQPNLNYTANNAGVVEVKASIAGDPTSDNYSFNPSENPEDLKFEFIIDPSRDSLPPEIETMDVTEHTYSVCTDFGPLSDIPIIGSAVDLLGCIGTTPFSQITASYEISDEGGSGLDYMEFRAFDSGGNTVFSTTHNIGGSSSTGRFHSPQINRGLDEVNDIVEIEVIVYDRAGKTDSITYSNEEIEEEFSIT